MGAAQAIMSVKFKKLILLILEKITVSGVESLSEEENEDQEDEEEVSKLAALQEEVLKASLEYLKDD